MSGSGAAAGCVFAVVDHVRDYPRFRFGGHEGTKVCTVAFQKQQP